MASGRTLIGLLLLVTVPTPACTQCTSCNQQPSQVYYNSQVAVQPANNGRPAGQFQPPTSVSRNQQIYVWYGQPQPVQNQINQALGIPQNNGVQPQYNPNYANNNGQPVMYNNINRDQPNYANQPYNPNVQQQTPRPNNQQSIPGFLPPAGVPSTAFPYSTTTPAYNTVASLAPINQNFDQPPTYLNAGSTTPAPYGPSSTAAPVTTHAPATSSSASQFVFTSSSSSTPSPPSSSSLVPSPYLAEGFTPTPSPPPSSNTNDSSVLAPLPVVFPPFPSSPPVPSSSVNVVPIGPPAPSSNTVIISQTYSGPAVSQSGVVGQAPSSFSQIVVGPNQATQITLDQGEGTASLSQTVAGANEASQTRIDQTPSQTTLTQTAISTNQTQPGSSLPNSGTVTQTVVGGNQATANQNRPSTTTFTFVGSSQNAGAVNQGQDAFVGNQALLGSNQQSAAGNQFGADQLPVTNQPGSSVTPLPVVFPAAGASNQVAGSGGPAFQPNPSASGQSSTAFVQASGPAISQPVGSQPQFQPNPAASDFGMQPNPSSQQQFQPSSTQVPPQQQPYNPAVVTSQTAPVSNQYDPAFAPQQQQGSAAAAAVGGGSAAVAAAALAAAAAAGNSTRPLSTTPFPYSTQFNQGTAMPTIQPAPSASQIPLMTQGSMQPTTSTLAYSTSPSPPTPVSSSTLASSPSTPSSTTRVPSTTPFPASSSPSTQQPLQQQQVLQPSQQLQQQPLSSTAQPTTASQVYSPSTTAFPYSTQFNQGTPMPTGTASPYYSSTMPPTTQMPSTMSPTTFYPSTTTMAPQTFPTTTTPFPSTQPQFTNTLQPSQQLQQQPYVQSSTQAPYSTQGPQTTTPVQIGYNPAGQPVYAQPGTSTQAPFVSTTPTTPYAQSTTPYGSPYPMTGTPVNQGGIGVNNVQGTTPQPYYPSTTPSTQQPFYNPSTTQQPFNNGPTTAPPGVYQIGQGVGGSTMNPQFNTPPNVQSSTYSPYAASGSTLGNQVLYDPSTGLVTANGMNTMYGRYTTMEPGSQMMRDVPINGGATLSLAAGIAALLFLF